MTAARQKVFITPEFLADAKARDLTYAEAAAELGLAENSIRNACWKAGIKLRTTTGRAFHEKVASPALDAPLDPSEIDSSAICLVGCLNLWRSVLLEQMRLALTIGAGAGHHGYSNPLEQGLARNWFGTRDFHMVCALAGFDGDAVLDAYQRQLADALRYEAAWQASGGTLPPRGPGYFRKAAR